MKTAKVIRTLWAYAQAVGLSRRELAQRLGLPLKTIEPWFSSGRKRYLPSAKNAAKLEAFLADLPIEIVQEARKRAEKVRWLLLLLEDELSWFKEGTPEARQVFRANLDVLDTGYLSSLLTMIQDEDAFTRWRKLTTNRFRRFRGRGSYGKEGRDPR